MFRSFIPTVMFSHVVKSAEWDQWLIGLDVDQCDWYGTDAGLCHQRPRQGAGSRSTAQDSYGCGGRGQDSYGCGVRGHKAAWDQSNASVCVCVLDTCCTPMAACGAGPPLASCSMGITSPSQAASRWIFACSNCSELWSELEHNAEVTQR